MARDTTLETARRAAQENLQVAGVASGHRPCATLLANGAICSFDVPANLGDVTCQAGHCTVGLASGQSRRGGAHAPQTVATWVVADAQAGRCLRVVLARRSDDTLRIAYLPWKTVPAARYGTEALSARVVVLTDHAAVEAFDEQISLEDIRLVLDTGTVTQVQPGLVHRIDGRATDGRPTAVCYRLNDRHEVVVITTFLVSEVVGVCV